MAAFLNTPALLSGVNPQIPNAEAGGDELGHGSHMPCAIVPPALPMAAIPQAKGTQRQHHPCSRREVNTQSIVPAALFVQCSAHKKQRILALALKKAIILPLSRVYVMRKYHGCTD